MRHRLWHRGWRSALKASQRRYRSATGVLHWASWPRRRIIQRSSAPSPVAPRMASCTEGTAAKAPQREWHLALGLLAEMAKNTAQQWPLLCITARRLEAARKNAAGARVVLCADRALFLRALWFDMTSSWSCTLSSAAQSCMFSRWVTIVRRIKESASCLRYWTASAFRLKEEHMTF